MKATAALAALLPLQLSSATAAAGILDESFADPAVTHVLDGSQARVTALLVQPDGKILIGGSFDHVAGELQPLVARLEANGELDPSFASPFDAYSTVSVALALDASGNVFVGGAMRIAGVATPTVVKLTANGAVVSSFALDTQLNLQVPSSLAVRADELYVSTIDRVLRVTATGALDPSFTVFAPRWVYGTMRAVIQPDGAFVALGITEASNEGNLLWRTSNGEPGAIADLVVPRVGALFLQSGGDLIISGRYAVSGGYRNFFRVKADGALDETYSELETASFLPRFGIGLQADDKLLLEGQNQATGDEEIRRFTAQGAFDDFSVVVDDLVTTSAPYPGERMMIAGVFTEVEGAPRLGVARLFGSETANGGAGGTAGADGTSAAGAPATGSAAGAPSTGGSDDGGARHGHGAGADEGGSDASDTGPGAAGEGGAGDRARKRPGEGCDCAIAPDGDGFRMWLIAALALGLASLRRRSKGGRVH